MRQAGRGWQQRPVSSPSLPIVVAVVLGIGVEPEAVKIVPLHQPPSFVGPAVAAELPQYLRPSHVARVHLESRQ